MLLGDVYNTIYNLIVIFIRLEEDLMKAETYEDSTIKFTMMEVADIR